MKKRFKSVRDRLTFWFLIVAVLPMILTSGIAYYQRITSVQTRMFEKLIAIRELKIKDINGWLDERIGDIETMSHDPMVKDLEGILGKSSYSAEEQANISRIRESLTRYIENYSDYQEIYILNPVSGIIEISTNKTFEGEDRSDNPYFTEALKTGGLYIKDIFYSANLNMLSMTFSIPIRGRSHSGGHAAGVLVVRVNLNKTIYAMLMDYSGMGETGETLIVNKDRMVLNEIRDYPSAPLKLKLDTDPARLALSGEPGIVESRDFTGKRVLAAYGYIPRLRWGFIAKQDLAEVNAPIRSMLFNFLFTLSVSMLLVYWAALFLSRSFSRPLVEMTEVSKRIQEGDMDARNTVSAPDEFGFLAEAFNHMADAMKSQMIIRQAGTQITEEMVSATSLIAFRKVLLGSLMEITGSEIGAYFLHNRDKDCFEPFYSVGAASGLLTPFDAAIREGEFGQALVTQKISHIKDIPQDTPFIFKTISGGLIPREMVTIPVMIEDEVRAIISLASLKAYKKEVPDILNRTWWAMNVTFSNLVANEETQKLAEELSDKNQELQAQAQQLKSQTYELRQQSKELQKQNIELEIKRKQVEEANRLKSQFLSTMSHELRTPLNSIMALSRVLLMQAKGKISEEEASYLEIIERNGKNLLSLINDILDLSKIEAGRIELKPKQFSLPSLIETILERLSPIALKKGIELRAQFPEGFPRIESDEARIHQIFQNLIGNAVKFTERGSVAISAATGGETISIEVADTGIGISEDHLPYIFDEFRQADGSTSRRYEGTGLGLAIAYKSAGLIGGTVTAKSILGKGSVFTVVLPVSWKGDAPLVMSGREGSHPLAQTEKKPQGNTVLVIDDNPETLTLICDSLHEEGYRTITATSGKEAIRLATLHEPMAITLDIVMPDMDGWEVLQNLKKNPVTRAIPVIIISISDDRETGIALGAVGYITKPFNKELLLCEIRKTIKRKIAPESVCVLIADDNEIERRELSQILTKEGMTVISAEDGRQCVEMLGDRHPDILVLDLVMPEMNGFQVLEHIRSHPGTAKLPVIIVTAKDLTDEDKNKLMGNVSAVLAKSDTTQLVMLEEIKNILADIEIYRNYPDTALTGKKKICQLLLVEDDEAAIAQMKPFLADKGYAVAVARDGREAIDAMKRFIPDGIILDLMMPNLDGFQVLEQLRGVKETAEIPVLILTAKDLTGEDLSRLSSNNVRQFIQKGDIDPNDLLHEIKTMLTPKTESQGPYCEKQGAGKNSGRPKSKSKAGKRKKGETLPNILIIEDNPDNMITLRAILKDKYHLIEKMDGEEGLWAAFTEHPDLVLLDMALPKIEGLKVAERIKKDADTCHVPVIAMTAHAMKGDREKMIAAGCDDYISKPFDPREMLEKINRWLEER